MFRVFSPKASSRRGRRRPPFAGAVGRGVLCALPALLLFLGGCSALLDREYLVVQPYAERHADVLDPNDLTADSKETLKAAMLWLVKNHKPEQTIRISGYPGDVRTDLLTLRAQISDEEPLGAYAVNYISVDVTQVLTQYTATIYITYRRTAEQIDSVRHAGDFSGLAAELRRALSDFGSALTVEMTYYDPQIHDVQALLRSLYYENPQWAMGLPALKMQAYPENSMRPILELELTFPAAAEELSEQARLAQARMLSLVGRIPGDVSPPVAVLRLHDILRGHIAPAEREETAQAPDPAATLYAAAYTREASSEGYALAFKRACDMLRIDSRVVSGYRNGDPHFWNLVFLEGMWYHIDVAADDAEEGYETFLRDDTAMEEAAYRWDKTEIPRCDLGPLSYERIMVELNAEPPSVEEASPPEGGTRETDSTPDPAWNEG